MAYADLPENIRMTAESVLTRKQLDVFKLWCREYGTTRIARILDISEPVARRTLERAQQKIRIALEKEDAA